jgi:hypothetical protein
MSLYCDNDQEKNNDWTNNWSISRESITMTRTRKSTEIDLDFVISLDDDEDEDKDNKITDLESDVQLKGLESDKIFTITKTQAMMSQLLVTMMKLDKKCTDSVITLPIHYKYLQYIVEYMIHHNGIESSQPLEPMKMISGLMGFDRLPGIGAWNNQFINRIFTLEQRNQLWLHGFLNAVNAMDIPSLLSYLCAKYGLLLKGKTNQEQVNILNCKTLEGFHCAAKIDDSIILPLPMMSSSKCPD